MSSHNSQSTDLSSQPHLASSIAEGPPTAAGDAGGNSTASMTNRHHDQVTAASAPAWERSKENAAPIPAGRKVEVLDAAWETSQEDKDRMLAVFEQQVKSSSSSVHPDPLVPWLELINFLQTIYRPSEPAPRDVLEACVLEFFSSPRYEQDVRFCKICCRYATLDAEPLALFQQLHDRGIGTSLSVFWMAWAWQAETLKDYELARRVLEDGLHSGAQPWTQLSQRFQQFVRRQKRRERQLLEDQQQQDEEDSLYASAQQPPRGALGRLTESAVRRNDRSASAHVLAGAPSAASVSLASRSMMSTFTDRTRAPAAASAGNGSSAGQQAWQIHVDSEPSPGATALDRALARRRAGESPGEGPRDPSPPGRVTLQPHSERRKENLQRAEAWNERGGLEIDPMPAPDDGSSRFRSRPPSNAASFEVFVDPECAAEHEKDERQRQRQLHQQQQSLRGGDFDVQQPDNHAVAQQSLRGGDFDVQQLDNHAGATHRPSAPQPPRPPHARPAKRSAARTLWWDVPNAAFDKELLMDSAGDERCFEEARAVSGCYRLLSIPPSARKPGARDSLDCESSVMMNESATTISTNDNLNEESQLLNTSNASIGSQQGMAGGVTSLITPRNHLLLNMSTETQESLGLGRTGATGRESNAGPTPTVNTKWALNQISVMFYSPASVDSTNAHPNDRNSRGGGLVLDMSSSFTESSSRDRPSSFDVQARERRDASVPPRHRTASLGGKQTATATLADDRAVGGFVIHRDAAGASTDAVQDDKRRTQVSGSSAEAPSAPANIARIANEGLSSVVSTRAKSTVVAAPPVRSKGFVIFQDEAENENEHRARLDSDRHHAEDPAAPHRSKSDPRAIQSEKTSGFVIYREDEDCQEGDQNMDASRAHDGDVSVRSPRSRRPPSDHYSVPYPHRCSNGDGDTASFSELGEAFDPRLVLQRGARDGDTANYDLVQELLVQPDSDLDDDRRRDDNQNGATGSEFGGVVDPNPFCSRRLSNEPSFASYSHCYNERGDDTATFSDMGDVFDQRLVQARGVSEGKTANFEFVQELLVQPSSQVSFDDNNNDLPTFGDVSCIAPTEEYETTNTYIRLEVSKAINYKQLHDEDTRVASRRLREKLPSRSDSADPTNLHELLSTKTLVRNYPIVPLPRFFKKTSSAVSASDRELRLARLRFPILHELGRGAYGAVALLDDGRDQPSSLLAVKGQKDTGGLAWEYEILERLHGRFSRLNASTPEDLFPSPLSFVFLSDGALMGMTPELTMDKDSLNLVDLVNVYLTHGKCVDEILVLHYTCRMLRTVELLHRRGRILHCDVKADNWVLVNSRDQKWVNMVASDLILVDFGRAVDLESVKSAGVSPCDVQLVGDATCGRMKCVAMRRGLPWSYDIDTFGICASVHALLYAEHMELARGSNGKWMPREPQKNRRLEFTEVWAQIFDKLLNVDAVSKIALDSRPANLYTLHSQVVTFLDHHVVELKDSLWKQAQLLRASRPSLEAVARHEEIKQSGF